MSNETEELLTGRAGTEASQNYVPMPLADSPPQEDLAPDAAAENFIATRDAPAPIVEREFRDVQSGEKRPENETLRAEDAARNLSNTRTAEAKALADQNDRDLAEALDQLRGQELQPVAADERSTGRTEPQQPDWEVQAERDHATYQQATAEIDKNIEALLSDPNIRSRLEHEFSSVRAEVDQAKGQYQAATAQLATEAQGLMTALFPELANMNAQQVQGALAMMQQSNPQRFEQWKQLAGRTQQLVGVYREQQAQAAQQQRELAAAQLEQYRLAEVKRFEARTANENPETMKAIREGAFEMLEAHYGIPQDRMRQLASGQLKVDSTALLHSAEFQALALDALKYRMSRDAVAKAVTRPVPQVQRPGISEPVRIDDGAVASALARLNAPGGSEGLRGVKNAAQLLAARRGGRS
jgi:hypothetical protein